MVIIKWVTILVKDLRVQWIVVLAMAAQSVGKLLRHQHVL